MLAIQQRLNQLHVEPVDLLQLWSGAGIDDVRHCLDLATVTEVTGGLPPSFEARSTLALACAEAV